jgi:pimeloyl-ACP methyl ester carboxylesterase
VAADGWEIIAHLAAQDVIFHPRTQMSLSADDVFYGFLARSKANENSYVAAIRGTDGLIEWIEDGEFVWKSNPLGDGNVEQGFWGIYDSMSLVGTDGAVLAASAAAGIAKMIGATGTVRVIGHSLGSALATYLSLALAQQIGDHVSALLFASPRPGDPKFADLYARTVRTYTLYNYALDIVPHVPFPPQYATLPNARVIDPAAAQVRVRVDPGCDHHLICYCAMLDGTIPYQHLPTTDDQRCAACILGAKTSGPTIAKLLAEAARALQRPQ